MTTEFAHLQLIDFRRELKDVCKMIINRNYNIGKKIGNGNIRKILF